MVPFRTATERRLPHRQPRANLDRTGLSGKSQAWGLSEALAAVRAGRKIDNRAIDAGPGARLRVHGRSVHGRG